MLNFWSIYEELDNINSDDMGTTFMKLGMKMNETIPSTMGTLLSIYPACESLIKSSEEKVIFVNMQNSMRGC